MGWGAYMAAAGEMELCVICSAKTTPAMHAAGARALDALDDK